MSDTTTNTTDNNTETTTVTSNNTETTPSTTNTTTVTSSNTDTTSSTTTLPLDKDKIVFVKNNAVIDTSVTSFYDEIEIEDMDFDEDERVFYYPCPCGDRFRITEEEILAGEEIAKCPSCSLLLKVVYSPEDFIVEDDLGDSAITVA